MFEHEREALRDAEAGRERLSLLSEVTRLLSSSLEPTTVIRRTMSLVEGRLADSCSSRCPARAGSSASTCANPGAGLRRWRHGREQATTSSRSASDAPAAVAFRTGPDPTGPLRRRARTATDPPGVSTALGGAADRQRRGHRRHDLRGRAGPGLRGGRRLAGHRGGEPGRGRPVQRHAVPAGARRGRRAAARRPAGLAARRRGPARSTPSTGRGSPGPTPEATGTTSSSSATTPSSSAWATSWARARPAAALMGQVRSAIRAYAVSGLSPTEVLSSLDRLFDTLIEDRVVTAVVGTITPSTGRVVLSNAGHPPPAGGPRRRQRDLLPHATLAADCGRARAVRPGPGTSSCSTAATRSSCTRTA